MQTKHIDPISTSCISRELYKHRFGRGQPRSLLIRLSGRTAFRRNLRNYKNWSGTRMLFYPPRYSRHSNLRVLLSGLVFLESLPPPFLRFVPVEDFKDVQVNFRVLWNAKTHKFTTILILLTPSPSAPSDPGCPWKTQRYRKLTEFEGCVRSKAVVGN